MVQNYTLIKFWKQFKSKYPLESNYQHDEFYNLNNLVADIKLISSQ